MTSESVQVDIRVRMGFLFSGRQQSRVRKITARPEIPSRVVRTPRHILQSTPHRPGAGRLAADHPFRRMHSCKVTSTSAAHRRKCRPSQCSNLSCASGTPARTCTAWIPCETKIQRSDLFRATSQRIEPATVSDHIRWKGYPALERDRRGAKRRSSTRTFT